MARYILDTDHVSLAQRGQSHIVERIATIPPEQLAVSIITVQEQLRGRLAQVQQARNSIALIHAYKLLHETLMFYLTVSIIDFDEHAAATMDSLRRHKIRIGTLDLRIAAVTLAVGATLVTRNRRDFEQVPELAIEDWSVAR
jgi:tRNA(fMet)-specific endonuclease VapC